MELAAKNIVKGGYSYSGQRCTAVKVVLAMDSIADKLVGMVSTATDDVCPSRSVACAGLYQALSLSHCRGSSMDSLPPNRHLFQY